MKTASAAPDSWQVCASARMASALRAGLGRMAAAGAGRDPREAVAVEGAEAGRRFGGGLGHGRLSGGGGCPIPYGTRRGFGDAHPGAAARARRLAGPSILGRPRALHRGDGTAPNAGGLGEGRPSGTVVHIFPAAPSRPGRDPRVPGAGRRAVGSRPYPRACRAPRPAGRVAAWFPERGPRQASVNDEWPNSGQPPRLGGSLFRVSFENPCAHRDGLRTPTVIPPARSGAATARGSPWGPWHTG